MTMDTAAQLRASACDYQSAEYILMRKAADELDRLQDAKRRALSIADERTKESNALRAIARDARDHVPPDVLARIDAVLGAEKTVDLADVFGYGPPAPGWKEPS